MLRHIVLLLLALALSAGAGATVYKWVDADGRVHYSDRPVSPQAKAVAVKSAPTDPERIEAERKLREEAASASLEQEQTAAEAQAQAERERVKRAENCVRARQRFATLRGAQRPYRVQPDGERHYLSSEEIDLETAQAEADVKEFCN